MELAERDQNKYQQQQLQQLQQELLEQRNQQEVNHQQMNELLEWKKNNEIKLKKYAVELKSRQETIKEIKNQQIEWNNQKNQYEDEIHRLEKLNEDLMSNDDLERTNKKLKDENLQLQRIIQEKTSTQSSLSNNNQVNSSYIEELTKELNEEKEARKVSDVKVKKYALELRGKITAAKELKEENEKLKLELNEINLKFQQKEEEFKLIILQFNEEKRDKEEIDRNKDENQKIEFEQLKKSLIDSEESYKDLQRKSENELKKQKQDLDVEKNQKIKELELNWMKEKEQYLLQISNFEAKIALQETQAGNFTHTFFLFLYLYYTFLESLRQQLSKGELNNQNQNEEIISLNDQIKRLKVLLSKSRDLSLEREEETNRKLKNATLPWKSFQVEYCVEGGGSLLANIGETNKGINGFDDTKNSTSVTTLTNSNNKEKWFLLSTNTTNVTNTEGDDLYSPHIYHNRETGISYRWIKEETFNEWLNTSSSSSSSQESCIVLPSTFYQSMISSLQLPHNPLEWYSIENIFNYREEKLLNQILSLEQEVKKNTTDYESLTQQFQTYKQRAQTALKRIGKDEQVERQKQMDEEEALWNDMKTKIHNLELIISNKESEIQQLKKEKEDSLEISNQRIHQCNKLEEEIQSLQFQVNNNKVDYKLIEDKNLQYEKLIENLQQERNELNEKLSEINQARNKNNINFKQETEIVSSPVGEISADETTDNEERENERIRKSNFRQLHTAPLFLNQGLNIEDRNGLVDGGGYLVHAQVFLLFYYIFFYFYYYYFLLIYLQ